MSTSLADLKQQLSAKSWTVKLRCTYLHYVNVKKRFILAEKTCQWQIHFESTADLLDLFASSGHTNYATSACLYFQHVNLLQESQSWFYQQFLDGNHAVTRNNQYWSGLWSDLVIEQTLMSSIKSWGGLTRGWGIGESIQHMWVLSLKRCAAIHQAMRQLSDITHKSSK